ncbi:MAG: PAS/PAC sensor hybrid histidine kinase [bacterium]|nr:MAG: PAS/PAC sensor hybrid histidine kinase [bacterium]KAF0148979.1 MAG: PAS/PAC sensor hybrid histidine kinase [bacterium]KAF0168370.1 MAG: PAS/PAC sensor hybrid histidine kinase [bacterium]TXT21034.1 MAG: PAS/PAC sensor hybrid histidine kinase [bacterium]
MSHISFEALRVLLLLAIILALWLFRRRGCKAGTCAGLGLVMAGFGLMLAGTLLHIAGDWRGAVGFASPWNRLGEHLVGYLGGLLLTLVGLLRWFKAVRAQELRQGRMLSAITRSQANFIHTSDTRQAFDDLLRDILDLTGSEYGFIGEVHQREGQPYLKTHAITNIAWNEETRRFFTEHAPQGMEFTNLNTLFGAALRSGEPVIANDPARDPRSGGLPPGHPALRSFLGLPIHMGGAMVGMLGIANRRDGYDQGLIDWLDPLSSTIGQLFEARRAVLARQAIETSHRRLSLVASHTNNGVVITDRDGRVQWVNAGFERLTGYALSEVLGRKPGGVLHGPTSDPATVAQMRAALQRGESFEVEILNYAKDGHAYWISLSVDPLRDEVGQIQGYIGIETDISARKAAQAALEVGARHTQAVLDNVLDGIITIDGRGIIASFNLAAERIFGYVVTEVIGHNVSMLMPEPHRGQHDDYLRNYQASGVAKVIGIGREVEGQRKDGSTFPMELAVTAIDRDGQPLYIGIVRDISERKRMERLKREFISTVSHELRTPLTAIRGALGLIAGGALGELPGQVTRMIEIAHRNSEHLTHLINDLLDMEKMAAGAMRFDMQAQDLMPLVERAIETYHTYGEARRVSFRLSARVELAMVRVDAQRFLQVMANLLSNAAKFSPVDSQVEIAVTRLDDHVRVSVSDHGPGIPAHFRDRIFEKFSQADASDARPQGGSGLGLAITRELLERMSGQIGFDSLEGDGTTFHVDLPLLTADASEGDTDATAQELPGAPRLLVVEDNADVAGLLSSLLRHAGFNVDLAGDARSALARLQEQRYAAMTLDLLLPDQHGIEIIRTLRATPEHRDLPIIVVSALAQEGQLTLAGEFDAVDWLAKPFDESRLLTSVRQAVHGEDGRKPRVLHVEDDADLLQVVSTLAREIAEFIPARTLVEARAQLRHGPFSVVILDLDLPDGSGWSLMADLQSLHPTPRVIVLSAQDTAASPAEAVVATMLKSRISNDELLATLQRAIRLPTNSMEQPYAEA